MVGTVHVRALLVAVASICITSCTEARPPKAGAQDRSLPDKLCAISLMEKLPNLPRADVSIVGFAAFNTRVALVRMVNRYRSVQVAASELDKAFPFIDGRLDQQMRLAGGSDALREEIINNLVPKISDAVLVTLELNVADMRVEYVGICARGVGGAVVSVLDGAVR